MELKYIKTEATYIFFFGDSYDDYISKLEFSLKDNLIFNLSTRSKFRRMGYASLLIKQVKNFLKKELSISYCYLLAQPVLDNISLEDLISFYEKEEFSIKETTDTFAFMEYYFHS